MSKHFVHEYVDKRYINALYCMSIWQFVIILGSIEIILDYYKVVFCYSESIFMEVQTIFGSLDKVFHNFVEMISILSCFDIKSH